MRGRAYRRHQRHRAIARARRYLRWLFSSSPETITPERISQFAADRTPCSCSMCGNPRRFFGEVTRQELQAKLGKD